jgi:hypothetical protein
MSGRGFSRIVGDGVPTPEMIRWRVLIALIYLTNATKVLAYEATGRRYFFESVSVD